MGSVSKPCDMRRILCLIFLPSSFLYLASADDVVCTKRMREVVTIDEGDVFSFKTQAGPRYASKSRCVVTYKTGPSCSSINFSCSKFDLNSKKKSCKGGDKMIILADGKKKLYCKKSPPNVTTSNTLKVVFTSNKKTVARGAVCTAKCAYTAAGPPAPGPTGPISCPGCPSQTQVTPEIENLAKFAANHQQFPLLKSSDCGKDLSVKVVNASSQVVAGTNYFLTLAVSATVGEKCDRVSSFICTNVVVFRPLPFQCTGDAGSCDQLTRPEGIKCTADPPKPPPSSCICPALFAPVCTSNGQTFSNHCSARCQGFVKICDGPCPCKLT